MSYVGFSGGSSICDLSMPGKRGIAGKRGIEEMETRYEAGLVTVVIVVVVRYGYRNRG